MNILLVEPKFGRTWGKNNQHVGLLRIGNWLIQQGHNVQYVRAPDFAEWTPDEIWVTSMFTYQYKAVWEAIRQYRFLYPKAHIKLGGIYATLCPEHAEQSGADEVFVGQHPEAKYYPPDPSILPYSQPFAYLFTSYGCDRACTYCATHLLFGDGIEQLPPEKIIEDIRFLQSRGFNEIWLGDDNLLYNADNHIKPICEEIIRQNIKVQIKIPGGMSAIDFDEDVANLMWQAGVREFSFALESTDGQIRRKMGRGHHSTFDDIERACKILDGLGYIREDIICYFLIGLPYQTLASMVDTLMELVGLGIQARPQRLTPIPGTIDYKRMNLETYDLSELDYSSFVAPEQTEFGHNDLLAIQRIARAFMLERRYIDWLAEADKLCSKTNVPLLFRQSLFHWLERNLEPVQ